MAQFSTRRRFRMAPRSSPARRRETLQLRSATGAHRGPTSGRYREPVGRRHRRDRAILLPAGQQPAACHRFAHRTGGVGWPVELPTTAYDPVSRAGAHAPARRVVAGGGPGGLVFDIRYDEFLARTPTRSRIILMRESLWRSVPSTDTGLGQDNGRAVWTRTTIPQTAVPTTAVYQGAGASAHYPGRDRFDAAAGRGRLRRRDGARKSAHDHRAFTDLAGGTTAARRCTEGGSLRLSLQHQPTAGRTDADRGTNRPISSVAPTIHWNAHGTPTPIRLISTFASITMAIISRLDSEITTARGRRPCGCRGISRGPHPCRLGARSRWQRRLVRMSTSPSLLGRSKHQGLIGGASRQPRRRAGRRTAGRGRDPGGGHVLFDRDRPGPGWRRPGRRRTSADHRRRHGAGHRTFAGGLGRWPCDRGQGPDRHRRPDRHRGARHEGRADHTRHRAG